MIELFLGIALGAMIATDTGHEIGNKVGEAGIACIKKMTKKRKEETWYDAQDEGTGTRSER